MSKSKEVPQKTRAALQKEKNMAVLIGLLVIIALLFIATIIKVKTQG